MPGDHVTDEIKAVLAAAEDTSVPAAERAEMLGEIAMGLKLGIVVRYLAGATLSRIVAAISAYRRALRTFDRIQFFAILQNSLAIADPGNNRVLLWGVAP